MVPGSSTRRRGSRPDRARRLPPAPAATTAAAGVSSTLTCVRGFGQLERVNHPDRLRHPLRRAGPRGAGRFERITWDEALDEVARQLLRVRDTWGPAAVLDCSRTGSTSMLHSRASVQRLLHMFGGCTELWSNISAEAEV